MSAYSFTHPHYLYFLHILPLSRMFINDKRLQNLRLQQFFLSNYFQRLKMVCLYTCSNRQILLLLLFSISWGENEARYSLEQFIMLIWATKLTNYYMTIVSSLKFIGLNVSNCPFSLWVYQNIWSVKFQANYEIIYFMNCVHVFFQEISFVYYSLFASMWKHCDCELKLCKHETKLEKGETRINSNAL